MRTKQDKETAKPRVVLERTELAELEASLHRTVTVTLPKPASTRESGPWESGSKETGSSESGSRESAAKESDPKEEGPADNGPKEGGSRPKEAVVSDSVEVAVSEPPSASTNNAETEPCSGGEAPGCEKEPTVSDTVMDIINLVAGGYGGETYMGNGDVGPEETPTPQDTEASPIRPRLVSETSKKLPPKKRRKKEDKVKSTGDAAGESAAASVASGVSLLGRTEALPGAAEGSSATSDAVTSASSPVHGAFSSEEPKVKPKKSSKKRKLEEEKTEDLHNGMKRAGKPLKKKKKGTEVVDGDCNHVSASKKNTAPGGKKSKSPGKQKTAPPRTGSPADCQPTSSDGPSAGDGCHSQEGSVDADPVEASTTCAGAREAEVSTTGAQAKEVKAKPNKKKSKAVHDPGATAENPEPSSSSGDRAKKKQQSKKSKVSVKSRDSVGTSRDCAGVEESAEKEDLMPGNEGGGESAGGEEKKEKKKKKPRAPKKKAAAVEENGTTTCEEESAAETKPKKPAKPRKRKSEAVKEGQTEGNGNDSVQSPKKKIKLELKENGSEPDSEGKPKKKSRPKKKSTLKTGTASTGGNLAAEPSSGTGESASGSTEGAGQVLENSGSPVVPGSSEVKSEEGPAKTDGEEKKGGEKKPKKQLDPVKCEDCGRECRGLSSLSRHMKQVHEKVLNSTKFHCERCEFTAAKRIILAAHLEIHGIYLCHRCGYRSEDKNLVEEHKRTKHQAKDEAKQAGEKPANPPTPKFHCEQCDFSAFKRTIFAAHLETHDIYLCHRCGYRTEDRDLLEEHINTKHLLRQDVKLCRKCNRYIKGDQLPLEKHLEECKGPIPFACTECDRQFKYESLLRIHLYSHFPDQPKLHKCPDCDYTSNYKANLSNHISNLHVKRERHVKCPKCEKMFYNQGNMRRHLKLHTDERLYKCDKCDKAFRSRHSLRGHSSVHNPVTLKCGFDGCDKEFRSAKYCRLHKVDKPQNLPKKFSCPFEGCSFSFFKRSHLKRHEITHTGERNYHCPYPGCGKSFRHADNLKVHQRQHTNEKPVRCEFCDCSFRQRSSLHWHKKKFHGIGAKPGTTQKPAPSSSKSNNVTTTSAKSPASAPKEASETGVTGSGEQSGSADQNERTATTEEAVPSVDKADEDTRSSVPQPNDSKPFDMYEFMSDDEGEKSPVVFRRDLETYTPGVPPLPPPPESLLLKEAAKAEKKKKKSKKKKKDDETQAQTEEPSEGPDSSSVQVEEKASPAKPSKAAKETPKKPKEKTKTPKGKAVKEKAVKDKAVKDKAVKDKAVKEKAVKEKAVKDKAVKSPKKARESKKKAPKKAASGRAAKAEEDGAKGKDAEDKKQQASSEADQIQPVVTRKKAAAQKKALQKKSPPKKKTVAKKKAVKSPAIKSKRSPAKRNAKLARAAKKPPSTPKGKAAAKKKKAPARKKAAPKSPSKKPPAAKKSPAKESRPKRRSAASMETEEEEEKPVDKEEEEEEAEEKENAGELVAEPMKSCSKTAVVVGGKQAATLTPPDSLPDEEPERRADHSPQEDQEMDADDENENDNCDNDRDEDDMPVDDRSRSASPAVEEHVEENACAMSEDGAGREELHDNEGDQDGNQDQEVNQDDQENVNDEGGDEEMQAQRQEGDEEGDNTMMSSDDEMSNDIPLTPPRAPAPPPPQSPEYDEEEDMDPPEPPPPPSSPPPQPVMMHSVGSEVHQVPSEEQQLGSIGSNPEPCTPQSQPPPPPQPTPPPHSQFPPNPTSEADKDYLGQYLQQLNVPEADRDVGGDDTNRLQRLEELAEKPHESGGGGGGGVQGGEMEYSKSVITTNPNMAPLQAHVHDMSNRRMQILASDRQVEQHYLRDTPSTLPPPPSRLPDPLREAPVPYEGFSTLNPLSLGSRDNNLLRSNENLFTAPTTGASFMRLSDSEAMLQRQRMTTPFLPQNDRTALPRIPETTLRPTNPALIRRPGTMPREDMFAAPTMPQAMPRNPFTSTWSGQEVRPAHWAQSPYLQHRPIDRQPNATAAPFFAKDNYLTGRDFVFDPACRMTERNMFASLSSPQPQRELAPETFQLDRFDLSSYFSNYSGTASLDYSRSACGTAPKAFDERYRAPTAATMGEFRGLPQSSTTDMFSGIGVNSSFQLDKYVRDPAYPMYHPQMPGDTSSNSAFLTHPTPGQPPSVFDREYSHRSLYPQNTPYPFIDERQYPAAAKLSHPTAPAMTSQERDFMTRTNAAENQMQDPYRCGMLYMNPRYPFDSV